MDNIENEIIDFYKNYNINLEIVKKVESYAVTRYFIKLDRTNKTRLANVKKLVEDLGAELGTPKILFDINKKCFEIPNKTRKSLFLNDIDYTKPEKNEAGLRVCFGKNLNNHNVFVDLCKTPHLLIAGTTGSGKSVFINSIIVNLLNNYDNKKVNLYLVDPKKVELNIYKKVKQVKNFTTNLHDTRELLKNALIEIEYRYKMFEVKGFRNIESFNQGNSYTIPYKVIIIDELADLILQDKKEVAQNARRGTIDTNTVESMLCRIAQIGRACGFHLIVATQRPSSDIITGLIKANIPSRVAFSVATRVDSRVILDGAGAEKLTGQGDMLFKMVGNDELKRIQGIFVTDYDIEKTVEENTDKKEVELQNLTSTLHQVQEQKQHKTTTTTQQPKPEKQKKDYKGVKAFFLLIWHIIKWIFLIVFGSIYFILKAIAKSK